jgi:hypothetical protein
VKYICCIDFLTTYSNHEYPLIMLKNRCRFGVLDWRREMRRGFSTESSQSPRRQRAIITWKQFQEKRLFATWRKPLPLA